MSFASPAQFAVWSTAIPLFSAVIVALIPRSRMVPFALSALALGALTAVALLGAVVADGTVRVHMGGWAPPLGITLHADALAAMFVVVTAIILGACAVYIASGGHALYGDRWSWCALFLLWTGLVSLLLAGDAFNAFVCLELVTLASVVLITRADTHAARVAALRYLLIALAGSMLYLAGVALLYANAGTLDLQALSAPASDGFTVRVAAGLVTGGLLVKAAVFPLHTWLPSAHASAPAPVSAILSALVVKAAFLLLVRFVVGPFGDVFQEMSLNLLGLLGVGAIVWGSFQALAQDRIKRVIAYSTVAQLGYLAVALSLLGRAEQALPALVMLALAHALAKATCFLAAGNIMDATGAGGIDAMRGVAVRAPMTYFALALAAISLIGLPPSGGFLGKWLLLQAAWATGAWVVLVAVLAGSLLSVAYLYRLLKPGMASADSPLRIVPRSREWVALGLGVGAVVLGFLGDPVGRLLVSTPLSVVGVQP